MTSVRSSPGSSDPNLPAIGSTVRGAVRPHGQVIGSFAHPWTVRVAEGIEDGDHVEVELQVRG